MPTGELLAEFGQPENKLPNGVPDFDGIRRKYLVQLFELTKRPTILYYTDWFNKGGPASRTLDTLSKNPDISRVFPRDRRAGVQ